MRTIEMFLLVLAILFLWDPNAVGVSARKVWLAVNAGWHSVQPTPDQLYGCTVQQQAPNGDCP